MKIRIYYHSDNYEHDVQNGSWPKDMIYNSMLSSQYLMEEEDYVDYGIIEFKPDTIKNDFIEPGAVSFWDWENNTLLMVLPKHLVDENRITYVLKLLWTFEPTGNPGEYIKDSGKIVSVTPDGKGLPIFPGLGLFNLNLPIPWWMWAVLAAVSAERASRKNSILWGIGALVAAVNAYNKKKL